MVSRRRRCVSIPSNGSIQFLQFCFLKRVSQAMTGLNPLKRVNSILTELSALPVLTELRVSIPSNGSIQFLLTPFGWSRAKKADGSQSPQTGQFNSYQQYILCTISSSIVSQSPQTGQFNSYICLIMFASMKTEESQSPQTGQFNSYMIVIVANKSLCYVSIPSNGSIQFLRVGLYC